MTGGEALLVASDDAERVEVSTIDGEQPMRCTRCGGPIEDEDRYIETSEGTIKKEEIEPTTGRGTYHTDCWPGLAGGVDDSFDSSTQHSSNEPDSETRRPPADISSHSATDPIGETSLPNCHRCGETVAEGERFIALTTFVNHTMSGFFASIKRMLTGNFVTSTAEPVESGGMYHTSCWPGLARGVKSPLDFWINPQKWPVEQFQTRFGRCLITDGELRLERGVRPFLARFYEQHPFLTVIFTVAICCWLLAVPLAVFAPTPAPSLLEGLITTVIIWVIPLFLLSLLFGGPEYVVRYTKKHLRSETLSLESVDKVKYNEGGRLTCPSCAIIHRSDNAWIGKTFVLSWHWGEIPDAEVETVKTAFESHEIPFIETSYKLTDIH